MEKYHNVQGRFGVEENKKVALKWYTKAAKNKDRTAMESLGELYDYKLKPYQKNLRKSFYWTKKAAEHGKLYSSCRMVKYYDAGIGCRKNYKKAIHWVEKIYKNSAVCFPKDYGVTLYRLGVACFYGLGGLKKNKQTAYTLFSRSAEKNFGPAYEALAYFYENGIIVEKNLDKVEELHGRHFGTQ